MIYVNYGEHLTQFSTVLQLEDGYTVSILALIALRI